MEGRRLANFVIGKRIADKARAPHWTAAKNALKKGTEKLRKQCGAQVDIHQITPERRHGGRLTALEALMQGQPVILQAYRCVRAPNPDDFFDEGEFRIEAQTTVQIKVTQT